MAKKVSPQEVFTHFDGAGNAHMVDVGGKPATAREAVAAGTISMSAKCYRLLCSGGMSKGDVLGVARLAGIMASKKVHELIPLAHPLLINNAEIDFDFDESANSVAIQAKVRTTGKTGVEMEALTAVSIAALTVYDMCKSVDRGMTINNIRLVSKSGGKSGIFKK